MWGTPFTRKIKIKTFYCYYFQQMSSLVVPRVWPRHKLIASCRRYKPCHPWSSISSPSATASLKHNICLCCQKGYIGGAKEHSTGRYANADDGDHGRRALEVWRELTCAFRRARQYYHHPPLDTDFDSTIPHHTTPPSVRPPKFWSGRSVRGREPCLWNDGRE